MGKLQTMFTVLILNNINKILLLFRVIIYGIVVWCIDKLLLTFLAMIMIN